MSAADRLTGIERACLLRAARIQLLELQDQFNRLNHLAGDVDNAAADSAAVEVACLQRAISWLWRDHRAGDG